MKWKDDIVGVFSWHNFQVKHLDIVLTLFTNIHLRITPLIITKNKNIKKSNQSKDNMQENTYKTKQKIKKKQN